MENNDLDFESLPEKVQHYIDQLEKVRRDFVANVSHELRTPLTVIHGYIESLSQKNSDKSLQKIYSQMHKNSMRMQNLIDDLLLLSRLESEDKLSDETLNIDIAEVLKPLHNTAIDISGDKQHLIQLDYQPNIYLDGNISELKSLFSNIIFNAIKYTPEKGVVSIAWYLKDGQGVFEVSDTGIGIAKKHLSRITERFYRVDTARSRESGGTGLGLAIAKHIVLRHEGILKIESQEGKGSNFYCIFPKNRTSVIKMT